MSQTTREVCVLASFKDNDGTEREKGDVFSVAYETERQRRTVNALLHRGFLTFDVETAKEYLDEEKKPAAKKTAAKKP